MVKTYNVGIIGCGDIAVGAAKGPVEVKAERGGVGHVWRPCVMGQTTAPLFSGWCIVFWRPSVEATT